MYRAVVKLKLDHGALKRKIDKALENSISVRRAAYVKAYGIFRNAKRAMLREFDRHVVTQEIEAGPNAANISGTLDGYGNLFSFIGFYEDSNPVEQLRALLENIPFEQTVYRDRKWYFRVRIPSKEDVAVATPMPWELGNSWALAVETYISGLSHYMFKKSQSSRSGRGIQLPDENFGEDLVFSGKPYITEILRNFRDRINASSD